MCGIVGYLVKHHINTTHRVLFLNDAEMAILKIAQLARFTIALPGRKNSNFRFARVSSTAH